MNFVTNTPCVRIELADLRERAQNVHADPARGAAQAVRQPGADPGQEQEGVDRQGARAVGRDLQGSYP